MDSRYAASTHSHAAGDISSGTFALARIPTITNAKLENSTISGVSLGGNLATLTPGTGLSGSSYNGSIARTFAVQYGTSAGTAAQGNDSRINNGQTAYSWGNHASANYVVSNSNATLGATSIVRTVSGSFNALVVRNNTTTNNNSVELRMLVTNSDTAVSRGATLAVNRVDGGGELVFKVGDGTGTKDMLKLNGMDSTATIEGQVRVDRPFNSLPNSTPISNFNKVITRSTDANGAGIGIAFRISAENQGDRTPGAAIVHERTNSNSQGNLHFKTIRNTTSNGALATSLMLNHLGDAYFSKDIDVTGHGIFGSSV